MLGEYTDQDLNLSVEQKILEGKRESCHSRDLSKLDELGLEGVVFQMSEYDHSNNSKDRDGKKINCGDEKYYYNRKVLSKGVVYHQLNNRWYVISGGELDYVSSWELFDYGGESRRKELTKTEKINKLEQQLKKQEELKNYSKCASINNYLNKLKGMEVLYNIWSIKNGSWWGANDSGYNDSKRHAGIYLESEVLDNQSYYNNERTTRAVRIL